MNDTKNCPYCGKEIKTVAKKCRYCGEWLNDISPDSHAPRVCVNTTIHNMPTESYRHQSTAKETKDFALGMAKGVGIAVIGVIAFMILILICWKLFG